MALEQVKDEKLRKLKENMKTNVSGYVTILEDMLFLREEKNKKWKLIIPENMKEDIIKETHEIFGHPGRYKTLHAIRDTCTFKNMQRMVGKVVKNCDLCQKTKPINFNPNGPRQSHKPTRNLEVISIDLMGPLPVGRGGVQYILTLLDPFSKYIKLYALKKQQHQQY